MKISLTLLVFSLLTFMIGMYIEYSNQKTISNDGWVRTYTIPKGKRDLSNFILLISGILFVGALLGFIWID
jgi:ABC-type Fe3+ transport system permease subunit